MTIVIEILTYIAVFFGLLLLVSIIYENTGVRKSNYYDLTIKKIERLKNNEHKRREL